MGGLFNPAYHVVIEGAVNKEPKIPAHCAIKIEITSFLKFIFPIFYNLFF